jgi:uncharacterized protein YbaP (TraB family)
VILQHPDWSIDMNWRHAIIFSLTLFFTAACGNKVHAANSVALWKLEKNGSFVYILGEHHGESFGVNNLENLMGGVLLQISTVAFEIHPKDSAVEGSSLSDGKLLSERVGDELVEKINFDMQGVRLPNSITWSNEGFNSLHPFLAFSVLEVFSRAKYFPTSITKRDVSKNWARQIALATSHKNWIGLEQYADRFELWKACDEQGESKKLLESAYEEFKQEKYMIDLNKKFIELMKTADIDAYSNLIFQEGMVSKKIIYECAIAPRNKSWLKSISSFEKSKESLLIVVGFEHLIGPNGLIKLLKEIGYTAEKIDIKK